MRVSGVAGTQFNLKWHLVGVRMLVPSLGNITVEKRLAADPFSLPAQSIDSVLRFHSTRDSSELVKVRGVVTYQSPGRTFISDTTNSLYISSSQANHFPLGTEVDVVGFPQRGGYTTMLADSIVRSVGQRQQPKPRKVSASQVLGEDLDCELVSVEGYLSENSTIGNQQTLVLQDRYATFHAFLTKSSGGAKLKNLAKGSRLRLAGICSIDMDPNGRPISFRILLRSPDDVEVLRMPSEWVTKRLATVVGTLGGLVLLGTVWLVALKHQVRCQTSLIRDKMLAEAAAERLMTSLVESLPQNILRKDLKGRFTFVNSFFCRTIGKPKEEILGKSDFDLFPAELASKYRADDHKVLESGKMFEGEEANRTADGEDVYVQVIKTPLFDADGKSSGLQVIYWDVTARRKAEQALRAQEERTRSIIDQAIDAVVTTDMEAKIIGWNRQAEAMFGWSAEEAIGKKLTEMVVPARNRQEREADYERFRQSGQWRLQNVPFETTGMHRDGREIPAEVSITPVRVGNHYIFNAFARDISARKEAEAKLETVNAELREASRRAGMAEVATSVLHNVGNVLNSINVTATVIDDSIRKSRVKDLNLLFQLLDQHSQDLGTFLVQDSKGRKIPGFVRQLAERLQKEQSGVLAEVALLRKNVNHIKDIISMQQGYTRVSGVVAELAVTELVEDALQMNAEAFSRNAVSVVREYEDVPVITTDKHKILQILVNLVVNARHACTESGKSQKQVAVRVCDANDRIKISITDNGVGILSENLTKIFSHGFTTRKDGHGFGLHSGALAAKELGGKLIAQSDGPGMGATFTLELPKDAAKQ